MHPNRLYYTLRTIDSGRGVAFGKAYFYRGSFLEVLRTLRIHPCKPKKRLGRKNKCLNTWANSCLWYKHDMPDLRIVRLPKEVHLDIDTQLREENTTSSSSRNSKHFHPVLQFNRRWKPPIDYLNLIGV